MNKANIVIAKNTLKILSRKTWNNVEFNDVFKGVKKLPENIYNKEDLLKNINRYIDYLLTSDTKSMESSSKRDMLFEVIMARFDILQKNRNSILNIYKSFKSKPQKLLKLIPSFLESMLLTAKLAKINTKNIKGSIKIKGIFLIYIATFFVWKDDNTKSIEKTMTSLDKYIDNAESLTKNIL